MNEKIAKRNIKFTGGDGDFTKGREAVFLTPLDEVEPVDPGTIRADTTWEGCCGKPGCGPACSLQTRWGRLSTNAAPAALNQLEILINLS